MTFKLKKSVSAIVLAISLITPFTAFAEKETVLEEKVYSDEYRVFDLVADYATQLYIDDSITKEELLKDGLSKMLEENPELLLPLLKTMISSLDQYSEYFTASEYESFINNLNRSFYGIGVMIQKNSEYVEITGFTKDSNSEKAGMKIGDKIALVNDVDMFGKSLDEVRANVMGELGTNVKVTVLRDDKLLEFVITRAMVNETTVECSKIDENIAYISISDMAYNTVEEFKNALALVDEWGIKNIVLDLRDNGGGYLISAVEIAKMIVPKGLIVDTVYRDGIGNESFYSELNEKKYNFNILVNEYTASAAEVLASAMQESGAAKLIGKETYGKAVIQQTYKLVNKSMIKLTVGEYKTRNGNLINEVGIKPDFKVSNIANYIDTTKYTSFDYKTGVKLGDTHKNVKAAKERFKLFGVYSGEADEVFDEQLRYAVIDFQTKCELPITGELDRITQVQLENRFAKIEVLEDKQFEYAVGLFNGTVK